MTIKTKLAHLLLFDIKHISKWEHYCVHGCDLEGGFRGLVVGVTLFYLLFIIIKLLLYFSLSRCISHKSTLRILVLGVTELFDNLILNIWGINTKLYINLLASCLGLKLNIYN